MRKFIVFLLMAFAMTAIIPAVSHAQVSWKSTGDVLTNVDTSVITTDAIADGHVFKLQATVVKASGTLAGKVYLKETLNGTDYIAIDSLTLTNVTRASKIFSVSSLPGVRYQVEFISSSGTLSATPSVFMIRRKQ